MADLTQLIQQYMQQYGVTDPSSLFGGSDGAGLLGGVLASSITITEIAV